MKILLGIFGILFFIKNSLTAIPSDIELCKVEDVNCIARVITDITNKNPNGKKDLNLPNLEPLKVNSLIISENSRSAVNLDLSFQDLDIYGLSKIKIDKAVGFSADPKTSKFELYATIPKLHLKGKYKANGRILILPIQGDGPCDIILDQVKISVKFRPLLIQKNDATYIGVDKLKLLLEPANMKLRLDNLFNGDQALGNQLNSFLNENWSDVWTELGPGINNGIAEVVKAIIINIFKIAPYEEIYKPN